MPYQLLLFPFKLNCFKITKATIKAKTADYHKQLRVKSCHYFGILRSLTWNRSIKSTLKINTNQEEAF